LKENFIGTTNNFSVEQISRSEAHAKNGMDELPWAWPPLLWAVPPRVLAGYLRTMDPVDAAEESEETSMENADEKLAEEVPGILKQTRLKQTMYWLLLQVARIPLSSNFTEKKITTRTPCHYLHYYLLNKCT
jgi:hypothetical protein